MRGRLIALAAAALLATGCGGGNSPGDAVSDLYSAAADGDASGVCEVLSEEAATAAAADENAESCEAGIERTLAGGAGALLGDIEVGEASVEGESGTVQVSAFGQTDTVDVVQEDGDWKVDESQSP